MKSEKITPEEKEKLIKYVTEQILKNEEKNKNHSEALAFNINNKRK